MRTNRRALPVSAAGLVIAALCSSETISAQAPNMDGQSGVFFQPWADVVPSADHQFGAPTRAFHIVDAGRRPGRDKGDAASLAGKYRTGHLTSRTDRFLSYRHRQCVGREKVHRRIHCGRVANPGTLALRCAGE